MVEEKICDCCGEKQHLGELQVCEGCSKRMADEMIEAGREIQEQNKRDFDFLENVVKKLLSKKEKVFLDGYLNSEFEYRGGFKIVDEPKGNKQEEEKGMFVYVDQWQNGDYSGDDFAGDCYFKLNNGKYLKWGYSC